MRMKKNIAAFFFLVSVLFLFSCAGEPLPKSKRRYAGVWTAPGFFLSISREGYVDYKRVKGSGRVKVRGPIRRYEGNDLIVGIAFFTTRFRISSPPRYSKGRWRMTVDGVELTRK